MRRQTKGPIAIIDVGSHSTRLEIFQVVPGKGHESLESLSQNVPLGVEVFTKGSISAASATLVGNILKDFTTVMKEYGVRSHKAIATAAVREAVNRELFITHVEQISGLRVETLEAADEIKLVFQAIRDTMGDEQGFLQEQSIACVIGTGSTMISFVDKGTLVKSEEVRVGSLRLMEEIERPISANMIRETIDPFVKTMAVAVFSQMKPLAFASRLLIAAGASVRALLDLADEDGQEQGANPKVGTLSRGRFEALFNRIAGVAPEELAESHGLSDIVAESMESSCVILRRLFEITNADTLLIPLTSTREAILQDFIRELAGKPSPFDQDLDRCAESLGARYHCDARHANAVAANAMLLFDKTRRVHGLGDRDRQLLRVAALNHDIGLFVSLRRHHKHSFYLIQNSQLPGISQDEQHVVAAVARYHRGAMPRESHPEYTALSPANRVLVCKLAAILRIADSLDFSRKWKILDVRPELKAQELLIHVEGRVDLALENWTVTRKANLFKEVFGLKARIVGGQ